MTRPLVRMTALAVFAMVVFAIAMTARDTAAQQGSHNHELAHPWTLLVWQGPHNIPVLDALSGTGAAEGGDDVSDIVTAIFKWDGDAQAWEAFFPSGVGIPGANDFETLDYFAVYWVAINQQGGADWNVPIPD